MARILTVMTVAVCAMWASTSSGSAMGLSVVGNMLEATPEQSAIIKVHSRRQSHHMLHDYGYSRIRYFKRRFDADGRPQNTYRAYQGRREYHVTVDWYGDIVDRHRAEQCY